jgi:intracellular sulfur oxidation DsrE/DsrF family protein
MNTQAAACPRVLNSFAAACLVAAGAVLMSSPCSADSPTAAPLIADHGQAAAVENAGERPDPALDYKVVLSAVEAGEAGEPAPALERAARLLNLLASSGVPAEHRHLVVIVYGPATAAVLTEAGRKARGLAPDPSAGLIAELVKAGVSVRVCGQALAGKKIPRDEVLPEVQVDLSAITTLSTLQLKGYAFLPD